MAQQRETHNYNSECTDGHSGKPKTALESVLDEMDDTVEKPITEITTTTADNIPTGRGRDSLRKLTTISQEEAQELRRNIRESLEPICIPEGFYSTPELQQISKAAARYKAHPDGVLLASLAVLASTLHPSCTIKTDGGPIRPNFYAGVVSPPGGGKDRCLDAARMVLPVDTLDEGEGPKCAPLGSGEGLLDLYMGSVKNENDEVVVGQTESRVLVNQAEASNLFALMDRSSSTLASNLLNMWGGSEVGTSNTTAGGRTRQLKSGSYRFAMTIGFQPAMIANLLSRADVGFPHRFVLANAIPYHRDRFTGSVTPLEERLKHVSGLRDIELTLEPTILSALDAISLHQLGRMVAVDEADTMDSHLYVILAKLTSLIALLHGRHHAIYPDFEQALDVYGTSQDVRRHAQEVAEELERVETARRAVQMAQTDEIRENCRDARQGKSTLVSKAIERMVKKARREGLVSVRDVKKAVDGRQVAQIKAAGISDSPREHVYQEALSLGLLVEVDGNVKAGITA